MTNNHRRMVGMAIGATLAPPLIALLASPVASADPSDASGVTPPGDITTYGPYTFDGYSDTLSISTSPFGADNYIDPTTFDLDTFYGGSDTYGVLLTDPGLFQLGYTDVDGTITDIFSVTPADFINPDIGLGLI